MWRRQSSWMAIEEQLWQPESPFTEFEEEDYVLPQLEAGFGEEEVPQRLARVGLVSGSPQGTGRVFVRITGRRLGVIAGNSTSPGHEGWLVGTSFDYELKSPRDVVTGQASGRRQQGPVTLTLPWSPASPLLLQAAATNDVLSSVVFEFPGVGQDGIEVISQRITLTDASVASYRHVGDPAVNAVPIDRVTLTFRQIAFQDLLGGTSAQDDWTVRSEIGPAESWEAGGYEIDDSGVQRSEADVT